MFSYVSFSLSFVEGTPHERGPTFTFEGGTSDELTEEQRRAADVPRQQLRPHLVVLLCFFHSMTTLDVG